MNTSFIYLSEHCEITDISESLLSLPQNLSGKDFLSELLGKSSVELLEEFCLSGNGNPPLSLPLVKKFYSFTSSVAVKCSFGGAILYLLEDSVKVPITFDANDKAESDHIGTSSLRIGSTSTDTESFFKICSRIASSLTEAGIPTHTDITESCSKDFGIKSMPLLYTALIDTVTALLNVLSSVVSESISFNVTSFGSGIELTLSGNCDIIPPFSGNSLDIMSLAPYLRGSRPFLTRALFAADSIGFSLSTAFSPTGRLDFNISNIPSISDIPEFKFPTENEEEAAIIGSLIELLLSVDQKKDKENK